MSNKNLVFITGPVGCGKTQNGIKLALHFDCAEVQEEGEQINRAMYDARRVLVLTSTPLETLRSLYPDSLCLDYFEACRQAKIPTHDHTLQFRNAMEGNSNEAFNITFIIAPAGCAFHHIGPISQSMKAMFVTEVYRGTCAEDLPKLIGNQPGHNVVFVNTSREALQLIYPNARIIGYYDACRAAGVSPFHTGSGQLIAPLNHAASLAAAGSDVPASVREAAQLKPREIYGVLMEIASERAKQISKGYDSSHDDEHASEEIAAVAAWYAMPDVCRTWDLYDDSFGLTVGEAILPEDWATPEETDRRKQLIKAAALLVAEVERLDRELAFRSYVMCEFCHGLNGDHKTGCCRVSG